MPVEVDETVTGGGEDSEEEAGHDFQTPGHDRNAQNLRAMLDAAGGGGGGMGWKGGGEEEEERRREEAGGRRGDGWGGVYYKEEGDA